MQDVQDVVSAVRRRERVCRRQGGGQADDGEVF